MNTVSELQRYFSRIGYEGNPSVDLTTLNQLQQLHAAAIPFENIDVLLDRGIDISATAIVEKLIDQTRGGYCFEQNNLYMSALREIGFDVEPLLARVTWMLPENAPAGPRTHMVLRVYLNGAYYLTDVGFGGLVITNPLQFSSAEAQSTDHELFRLIRHQYGYRVEVLLDDTWRPAYDILDAPQEPIDFEVANWFTSRHPDSKFRHNLMMARVTHDTRYALFNNRFTIREKGKQPVQRMLNTDELAQVVADYFMLSVQPNWLPLFERLVNKSL